MNMKLHSTKSLWSPSNFNENICFLASQSVFALSRVYGGDLNLQYVRGNRRRKRLVSGETYKKRNVRERTL